MVMSVLLSLIAAHVLWSRLTKRQPQPNRTATQSGPSGSCEPTAGPLPISEPCDVSLHARLLIFANTDTEHDTMAVTNDSPAHSLDSLEARLQRISYALAGDQEIEDAPTTPRSGDGTAASSLRKLETQMQTLASRSSTVDQVLKLQANHPNLFSQDNGAEQPNTLALPSQAALVLSHAQLYSSISGQLQSLQETDVPDPTSASKLRELQPRIDKAAARQEQQATELAELRSRSAAAVEKWYETGVLGMAERWAEWEERMRDVEIVVRRLEAVKKRDEELV
jgi:hypothetical protein